MIAVARWKFDNSRSQSAFFEFPPKVGYGLVLPALGEKDSRNKRPTVGIYSPGQGSGGWSKDGQHLQREVKCGSREMEGVQRHVTLCHPRRQQPPHCPATA